MMLRRCSAIFPALFGLAFLAAAWITVGGAFFHRCDRFTFGQAGSLRFDVLLSWNLAGLYVERDETPGLHGSSRWFLRYDDSAANFGYMSLNRPQLASTHGSRYLGSDAYAIAGSIVLRHYWLKIPYLFPIILLLSAIPPLLWHRRIRRRRIAVGLCPTCSYDLRAHHPGQKCPECGTLIQVSAKP